jgi:hypothetical protein
VNDPAFFGLVLNHNGRRWLPRCLESLLRCDYSALRIVLVDNGSTDDSVSLARSISDRIEILELGRNLGFSEGNNAGISYALQRGAAYVALLNNDTYFEPDWVTRLIEVGEAQASIGILGPVHLVFDGDAFNSWMTSALPHLLDRLRLENRPGVWFPVEWVEGSAIVMKRAVLERVGWLDPIFFAFFEECDLCRRAHAAGFEVAMVPSSRIHHYRGGHYNQPAFSRRRALLTTQSSMLYNSCDPRHSLPRNLRELLRNNATHLKDALFGSGSLSVWCSANLAVASRLPALYRKWRRDRRLLTPDR